MGLGGGKGADTAAIPISDARLPARSAKILPGFGVRMDRVPQGKRILQMLRLLADRIAMFRATIVLLGLAGGWAQGQQAGPSARPPSHSEYQSSLLDELSKRNYSSRQQATLDMWRHRDLSRNEVQEAARHPDPEVSGRAKWILRQWRRGSLPDTPPEISRMLQRTDDPSAIRELLEAGQFAAVAVAVEESAGTVDRESLQKRVNAAITRRFPVYIKSAVNHDTMADLLKLIDLTADTKEMAVCRVQMMQLLGLEIDQSSLLPTSAETWTQDQTDHATVMVLTVLGRPGEALQAARDSGDETLIRICQMLSGRWREMAGESAASAWKAEVGSYEHTRLWCQALIAADRCGETSIFDESVRQLSGVDTTGYQHATELRWKCLAGHGQVDAALTILEQSQPGEAAVVAVASARSGRAFEKLGFPLDQIDLDIDDWIDDAIEAQRVTSTSGLTGELSSEVRNILGLMRCLITLGRHDAAWTIASRLCASDADVRTIPLREYVLSTLTMTTRRDWVLRLAERSGESAFSSTTRRTLSRTLPIGDEDTIEILMEAIRKQLPREPFARRLRIVCQLLQGTPPKGFSLDTDLKRLFDRLTIGKRQIQQLGGRAVLGPRLRLNLNMAEMFSGLGRADLASMCLQQLVENGDVEATLQIAESELDGGSAETADKLYQAVWSRVEGQGPSRRFQIPRDDVNLAAKALVGQWIVAKRTDDIPRRNKLLRQLQLTLCSPSTETRDALAGYLGDRGELDLALDAYLSLLPMTAFGTPEATGLYQVAWRYSRLAKDVDIHQAARWYDLAAGGTLESTDYRSEAYITLPLDVRRWTLEAAIDRDDAVAAKQHIERILQLDPIDIDMAERLLPEMREAGMSSLADEAFAMIMDRGMEHTQAFPFDATSCNNLAWVAAMNGKKLDDALKLAERAVYVEPDSAIYRDTLAEVLFQLDRKREALQVEESCVLDDPSQWHLHQQIKKYREALGEK